MFLNLNVWWASFFPPRKPSNLATHGELRQTYDPYYQHLRGVPVERKSLRHVATLRMKAQTRMLWHTVTRSSSFSFRNIWRLDQLLSQWQAMHDSLEWECGWASMFKVKRIFGKSEDDYFKAYDDLPCEIQEKIMGFVNA